MLFVWKSRQHETAALYGALILLFSSTHVIPVYIPSAFGLSAAATQLGFVTNFWMSVLGILFVYALIERPLPFKKRFLLTFPAAATIAHFVLSSTHFSAVETLVVVPFSVAIAIWILVLLVQSAVFGKRWDAAFILISIFGACALVIRDILVISNMLPASNFQHWCWMTPKTRKRGKPVQQRC